MKVTLIKSSIIGGLIQQLSISWNFNLVVGCSARINTFCQDPGSFGVT